MVDRRSFLRGLVLSVTASGLILPTSAEALVLGDRYQRLVTSIRAVIDGDQIYKKQFDGVASKQIEREYSAAWQSHRPQYMADMAEMFRVITEEFGDMTALRVDEEGTTQRLTQMFYNSDRFFDILDESELRKHEDMIVAIATPRILLTRYGVNSDGMTNNPYWKTFTQRYAHPVLALL